MLDCFSSLFRYFGFTKKGPKNCNYEIPLPYLISKNYRVGNTVANEDFHDACGYVKWFVAIEKKANSSSLN